MTGGVHDRRATGRVGAWLQRAEALVLLRAFCHACGVRPPTTRALDRAAVLEFYRQFTAGCAEIACEDREVAAYLRARLGAEALRLGRAARLLAPRSDALTLARLLYQQIGIGLSGELPGTLQFGPCFFAGRYTPAGCWFMSAFDEGFLRGVTGCTDGRLEFACRLTEGAPHCTARFARPTPEREDEA